MEIHIRFRRARASAAVAGALAAASADAVAQTPQAPVPDRAGRIAAAAAELPEGLRPSLGRALERVHRFERACLELGLLGRDGAVAPSAFEGADDAQLDRITEFLREGTLREGEPGVYPGAAAFAFGERGAPLEQLVECGRYHAGWAAARDAIAADPGLAPEHALAALTDAVLTARPLEGSEDALRFAGVASEQRRFAPLGNGGLCFVVWGLLHEPSFWEREGIAAGARADLIHAIVSRGPTTELATWTATRTLRPPLVWDEERPGRGVVFSAAAPRGRVGFSARDEAFVRAVRDRVVRGELPAESGPGERRLRAWCATMLHWILTERGTALAADEAMRRGTLDERKQYWTDLARRVSFDDFRAAYVDELVALGSRAEGLGDTRRIAALEALAETGELDPAEAEELARLRADAERGRTRLARHMGDLLVQSGGAEHYAAVAATLAGPTESLLADLAPDVARAHWLGDAWVRLGLTPSEQSTWVVEDHLDGLGPLPAYGLESLVMSTASWALPGAEVTLDRVLAEGDLSARSAAVANPRWMTEERFEAEWRRLARDHDGADAAPGDRSKARVALITSLGGREGEGARRLLLESFEAGRWRDPADPGCWWNLDVAGSRDRVLSLLSPEDRRGLVERGLGPAALLDG